MAGQGTRKVRGITIELNADTKGIAKAFGGLTAEVNKAKKAIADVNKLMVDATPQERTVLLAQKQAELSRAIEATKQKIEEEQKWLEDLKKQDSTPEVIRAQEALERQIMDDRRQLEQFQHELANTGKEEGISKLRDRVDALGDEFDKAKGRLNELNEKLGDSKGRERLELLRQKQEELNNTFELSKQKVDAERRLLEELEKADSTPEVIKEQEKLRRQLEEDEAELADLQNEVKEWGSVTTQQIQAVGRDLKELGTKWDSVGEKIINAGRTLTATVTTPIIKAGKSLLTLSTDFESAMAKVQSVTPGATSTQMENLANAAITMSENSVYSAKEAADALYYMGLAGWDAAEMMSALPNVLNLAAAGDMDLAKASDIVTDYVTAFGLTADESTRLVDAMAQTMANSNTNVEQMGQAFSYAAPVAGALGYSVEDVSHALGIMANNGIKGSKAGTALRMLMSRLAKPTAETAAAMNYLGVSLSDMDGNAYTLHEVLDQLRDSLSDLPTPTEHFMDSLADLDEALDNGEISEEEYSEALDELINTNWEGVDVEKARLAATIAGTRAMSGMLAIVNTTAEDYDGLYETIGNAAGATKEIAEVMMDTAEGSMTKLKHELENIGRELGDMMIPYIRLAIDKIKEIAKWFKNLDDNSKETVLRFGLIAGAIGPVVLALGGLTKAIGGVFTAAGALISFIASAPAVAAIGGVAVGVGAIVAVMDKAAKKTQEAYEAEWGLTDEEREHISVVDDLVASYQEVIEQRDKRLQAADEEIGREKRLYDALQDCVTSNGRIKDGMEERARFIANELSSALGIEIEINNGVVESYGDIAQAIEDVIAAHRREAITSAYQDQYTEALSKYKTAQMEMIDIAYERSEAELMLTEITDKLTELEEYYADETLDKSSKEAQEAQAQIIELTNAKEEYQKRVDSLKEAEAAATAQYNEYMTVIENYEGVMEAAADGDVAKLDFAITKLTENFKRSGQATEEELQEQYTVFKTKYEALRYALSQGVEGVTQEMVDEMGYLVEAAQAEIDGTHFELPVPDDYTEEDVSDVKQKALKLTKAVQGALDDLDTYAVGKNYAKGFAQGIDDYASVAITSAANLGSSALRSTKSVLREASPSRAMMESGRFFTEGFAIGIADEQKEAINAAAEMARSAMNAVGTPSFGGNWNTPFGGGNVNNTTYGAINVTVNGANTSNADELAQIIADRINREVNHRKLVTA